MKRPPDTGDPARALCASLFLAELPDGGAATIRSNPNAKSREMGLAPGAHVRMLRNHRRDHAVVVAVGDARFFVSRTIAARIALETERETASCGNTRRSV